MNCWSGQYDQALPRATHADPHLRGATWTAADDGGYDAVRRYARRWAKERGQSTAAAYVPPELRAGGSIPVLDWSHEVVLLSGVTVIVKAAHVRPALSQPDAVRAGLSARRDARRWCSMPTRPGLRPVQGRWRTRHLRQHEDGGGDDLRRQATPLQSPLPADVQRTYYPRFRIRLPAHQHRAGRRGKSRTKSGSSVSGSSHRVCGSRILDELNAWLLDKCITGLHAKRASPSGADRRADDLGGVRGRAAEARSLCRQVRWIPRGAGIGLEGLCLVRFDNNRYSGGSQCGQASGRGSCLCGSHRNPPGRADRR